MVMRYLQHVPHQLIPCLRGFKALKQSTKLLFLTLHRPKEALGTYTQLLAYTKSAVTKNDAEKTINGILDYVGGGKGGPLEVDVLQRFYEVTMNTLLETKNDVSLPSLLAPSNPS
jgi:COP9 signalosome complex subunit 2